MYSQEKKQRNKEVSSLKSREGTSLKDNRKLHDPIQRKPNNTGLPDQLKSGIENLSGHSMNDVKVHYNSSKPAQLNAHAYAQGTNIHLACGQEKHLPHEAWHVVQQKQGRVQPTTTIGGQKLNDNVGLEKEADVMGAESLKNNRSLTSVSSKSSKSSEPTIQGKFEGAGAAVIKLLSTMEGSPAILNLLYRKIEALPEKIQVNLTTGRLPMNYNFSNHSLELNGTLIRHGLGAKHENEKGWQKTMAFIYASASHELRHINDLLIDGVFSSNPSGEFKDIVGFYLTELNAWQSEARAYLEKGEMDQPIVKSWISLNPEAVNLDNEIWGRLKQYTNGAFQPHLPPGTNWNSRIITNKILPAIIPRMEALKAAFLRRVPQQKESETESKTEK